MSIWEQNSEKAKQWLEKLLKLMAMPADVQIGVQELGTGPSSCWLIIDSSQLSPQQVELLLANKGEGLDAIQSLANTILNIGVESAEHQFYIVEINGYRQQRQAELFDWVNQAATQVRQTGQEIKRFNHRKSRRGTRSPVSNSFKIRPKGGVKPALLHFFACFCSKSSASQIFVID